MPLYQHRHIGHRLLERAERSIAPVCTRVELISLGAAENFYKLHNYATIYGGNTYVKNLVMSHCVDIPLFGYTACVKRMCANLMSDSDWYAVAKSHLPSFAYIGAGGHVDGIGLLCADTTASIVLRATNDWAHKCLGRTLDKYRADILHRTKVL